MTQSKRSRFPDTRWSLVGRAAVSEEATRQQAITELLAVYTPALRAFLVESRRLPPDLADDLVQGFVADKILSRKLVHHANQAKGKFRNFLLKSLSNFVTTNLKREYAVRAKELSFDLSALEEFPSQEDTDRFDRKWVQQVVSDALDMMEADCIGSNRMDEWNIFCHRVVKPMMSGKEPPSYEDLIRQFQIQTPRQAINLLVTAKRRFVRHLRAAVGRYVHHEESIDSEIVSLRQIVGR
ncbi:MAG: hypothetical protein ACLQPD_19075 [Desulfomonilaceae bacterium]